MTPDQNTAPDPGTDKATDHALPHERDQQAVAPLEDAQHRQNRKPIAQAHRDVESGLRDTERIGTPNDVPASSEQRGQPRR